eukprot:CAMPEP_0201727384 /NCGR_PEP_ID=MMETSP0593-20130828/12101_1 /ASSEMBLY_ACC=CAM_ASM_000672 /TAXON_ID=267983 /ORGANISM="Skeletonema japonicum, Strain CCMP2506" /LENGTH=96 /DNA_ID=CAMNT_0048219163 /DNA_START=88 /DNA_END=375 /DNA_ORIENTATION=+
MNILQWIFVIAVAAIPGAGASGANGASPCTCTGFINGNVYVWEPENNDMKTGLIIIYQWATAAITGELDMRARPHGKGKLTCSNGDIYDGEWKDGL